MRITEGIKIKTNLINKYLFEIITRLHTLTINSKITYTCTGVQNIYSLFKRM